MQTFLRHVDVLIPAGTPKATPQVSTFQFGTMVMQRIEWMFPHGCNGLVGIQIGARAVQILPYDRGVFFIRSGDTAGVDLTDMHDTGDWSVIGYNTGVHPHTIRVTFKMHAYEPPSKELFMVDTFGGILGMGES